ncbi:hypothetical protein [Persephonella sp.]
MSVLKEYKLSIDEIERIKEYQFLSMLKYLKDEEHINLALDFVRRNPWVLEMYWLKESSIYYRKVWSFFPLKKRRKLKEDIMPLFHIQQEWRKIAKVLPYGTKNAYVLSYLIFETQSGRENLFRQRLLKKQSLKVIKKLYSALFWKKSKVIEKNPEIKKVIEKIVTDAPYHSSYNPLEELPTLTTYNGRIQTKGFLKSMNGKIPFNETKEITEEEKKELKKIFFTLGKEYLKYKALYKKEINGNIALAKAISIIPESALFVSFLAVIGLLTGFIAFGIGVAFVSIISSFFILYNLLKEKIYRVYPKPLITTSIFIKMIKDFEFFSSKTINSLKFNLLRDMYQYGEIKEKLPELKLFRLPKFVEKAFKSCQSHINNA